MEVKVVIGTVAFMLTMIVLGYAALREPTRLEEFAGAAHGRSIEEGAELFVNNCASCHALDGSAVSGPNSGCTDPNNSDPNTDCVGLPLNNYYLLCGEPPDRLVVSGWTGSTENFIKKTVAAGRGAIMPAWSNDYGGPMRPDQVQNVTNYVLNWASEELCAAPPVEFPWPEAGAGAALAYHQMSVTDPFEFTAVAGDPALGEAAYQSYGCSGCHGQMDTESTASTGPWLGDIAENAADRIPGYSAEDYLYESILHPDAFIAPDCPGGPCTSPSQMASQDFLRRMAPNPQDLAHIMAYLLGDSYTYP